MHKEKKIRIYERSIEELTALLGDDGKYRLDDIGKMALISSLLRINFPNFFFVGFYRVIGEKMLQIGPYQGELIACGTIAFGKGVCGVCAERKETVIVDDVLQFPEYIACDDQTRSEIVVPVMNGDELIAVLDVDSADLADFDEVDGEYLERMVGQHFN